MLAEGKALVEEIDIVPLRSLRLVDRNDPIVDMIAKKIIEVGASGIIDPEQISKTAIKQLGL